MEYIMRIRYVTVRIDDGKIEGISKLWNEKLNPQTHWQFIVPSRRLEQKMISATTIQEVIRTI